MNDFCSTLKKTSGTYDANCFRRPLRSFSRQQSSASTNSSERIHSSIFHPNSSTTRLALLKEILDTELKYLKELQFLEDVYGRHIPRSTIANPEKSLTEAEFKTVFQPVSDLLKLHTDMYERFAILAENYDEITTCIGNLFV